MGDIAKMLAERKVGSEDNTTRLEIEEAIHFHYRDYRILLNKSDFLTLCDMFQSAKKELERLGSPDSTPHMHGLGEANLTQGFATDRLGIEMQRDDTVHIHFRDLRIHIKLADFAYWAQSMWEARRGIPRTYLKRVKIKECVFHPVVYKYIDTLKRVYKTAKQARDELSVRSELHSFRSNVGDFHTRNMGFPKEYGTKDSPSLDEELLVAITKSIEKFGYAQPNTPYEDLNMFAFKLEDGRVFLKGAHRVAALMFLGYDEIDVFLVKPESGWK